MDAEALVRPVVEAEGLELVEAGMAREGDRRVLRVTVDRPGGVDLDHLSEISEQVSAALDAAGLDMGPYVLEVSSPGIERPLRRPAQFARCVGERVKVRTAAPIGGVRTFEGSLVAADDEAIRIVTADGPAQLRYADIASARTVADWDAELKRSEP